MTDKEANRIAVSIAAVCIIVIAIASYAAGVWWGGYKCGSRWGQSGMATSYGLVQGCLIQHDGRWIPEQNYREQP